MACEFVAVTQTETAPLDDGAVIFHAETGKFVVLNRSATVLWNELTVPAAEDELARRLCAKFTSLAEGEALRDTTELLEQLRELGLVRVVSDSLVAD